MSCREVRHRLLEGEAPHAGDARHLARCPSCARFARRLELAREALGTESAFTPDAGFPRRVVARLPRGPELVGLAALRLLPAALALALVLTGWCLLAAPGPETLAGTSPLDDPLAWVAELAGEEE